MWQSCLLFSVNITTRTRLCLHILHRLNSQYSVHTYVGTHIRTYMYVHMYILQLAMGWSPWASRGVYNDQWSMHNRTFGHGNILQLLNCSFHLYTYAHLYCVTYSSHSLHADTTLIVEVARDLTTAGSCGREGNTDCEQHLAVSSSRMVGKFSVQDSRGIDPNTYNTQSEDMVSASNSSRFT